MRKSLFSTGSMVLSSTHDKSPASLQNINYLPKQKTFGSKQRKPLDFSLVREEPPTPISPFDSQDVVPSPRTDPQKQLRAILESTNRTDEEAWTVYDNLKHLKFFGQFLKQNNDENNGEDNFLFICKKLGYEVHPPGSVIMTQGDYSNGKVYIVLTGELNIFIQGLPPKASGLPQAQGPIPQISAQNSTTIKETTTSKVVSIIFDEVPPTIPISAEPSDAIAGKKSIMPNMLVPETFAKKQMKRESKMPPTPILDSRILDEKTEENNNSNNWGLSLHHIESSDKPGAAKIKLNKPDFMRPSLNFPTLPSDRDAHHPPLFRPESRVGKIGQGDASPSLSEIRETPTNSRKNHKIGFDSFEHAPAPIQPVSYGTLVNKINEGSYFGEKALFSNVKRGATIITSTKAELLTLDREDFKSIQADFTKSRLLTIQFLRDIFPNIASVHTPSLLENLIYNCEIKTFPYKKAITLEGEPGEEFYVVFEGQCEFSKTVIYDNSNNLDFPMTENRQLFGLTRTKKDTIVTSNVERGTFIGEEMLFNTNSVYEYTVRANSEKVRLVSFKKSKFYFRCPKKILEGLRDIYTAKKERNSNMLQEILQLKAGPTATPRLNIQQSQDGVKQIVSLEKVSQNNKLQLPHNHQISTLGYRPSLMAKSQSFRTSIKMTDVSNPNLMEFTPMVSLNGSQATIKEGSLLEVPKMKGNSSVKNLLHFIGNYVGSSPNGVPQSQVQSQPQSQAQIQESIIKQERKDLEELQRIKTEASMMPVRSSSIATMNTMLTPNKSNSESLTVVSARVFSKPSSPRPPMTNFNHLFTGEAFLDMGMRDRVLRSPERDVISPVGSPKHRKLVKANNQVKKDDMEVIEDEKMIFNEMTKGGKHNRVMSSWAAERKFRLENEKKQPKENVDFLKLLQSAKDHVVEKRKKDTKHFMKKSLEMTWKMEKTASIISFGTPRVTSPSENIRPSHRPPSKPMFYAPGFEKASMPKIRRNKKKRSTIKSKLDETLKGFMAGIIGGQNGACGKHERSKSMQASKIDMNVQFYSGFD